MKWFFHFVDDSNLNFKVVTVPYLFHYSNKYISNYSASKIINLRKQNVRKRNTNPRNNTKQSWKKVGLLDSILTVSEKSVPSILLESCGSWERSVDIWRISLKIFSFLFQILAPNPRINQQQLLEALLCFHATRQPLDHKILQFWWFGTKMEEAIRSIGK